MTTNVNLVGCPFRDVDSIAHQFYASLDAAPVSGARTKAKMRFKTESDGSTDSFVGCDVGDVYLTGAVTEGSTTGSWAVGFRPSLHKLGSYESFEVGGGQAYGTAGDGCRGWWGSRKQVVVFTFGVESLPRQVDGQACVSALKIAFADIEKSVFNLDTPQPVPSSS